MAENIKTYMSTITTIQSTDIISASRSVINTNFSNLNTDKAETVSPTFTGTVVLPSTTSIGNASATEIGYLDGVTSAIQTQLDAKATVTSGTKATTFTFDGSGGSSGALTLVMQKIGDWVTLFIPQAQATTGTSSTKLVSNTAIDAEYRPLTLSHPRPANNIINNNAGISSPGTILVSTAGIISIYRDNAATAFTNAAVAGLDGSATITYYVGSGS